MLNLFIHSPLSSSPHTCTFCNLYVHHQIKSMESTRATGQIVPMETETMRKEETQTPAMVQNTVHMPLEVVRVKKKHRSICGQALQVIFRACTALCMIPAVIFMALHNEDIEIVDNRYVIDASYRSSPAFG